MIISSFGAAVKIKKYLDLQTDSTGKNNPLQSIDFQIHNTCFWRSTILFLHSLEKCYLFAQCVRKKDNNLVPGPFLSVQDSCMKTNMIRNCAVALLTFCCFSMTAQGQLADKATFFGGFNYQIVSATPLGQASPWRFPFYGLSLGMDYVLLHSNDQVSLGVNPNVNFSFLFNSRYGTSLLAQAPVFLLARLGSGSTPYNEQKFGIGAGIGAVYTYMSHSTVYQSNGSLFELRFREGFINPSAVVELAIRTRFSNYLFRFNWSLLKPNQMVDDVGIPFDFGTAGLGIMYNF